MSKQDSHESLVAMQFFSLKENFLSVKTGESNIANASVFTSTLNT